MERCSACNAPSQKLTARRNLCPQCAKLWQLVKRRPGIARHFLDIQTLSQKRAAVEARGGVRPGRLPTVGKFKTRKEFEEHVLHYWQTTDMSIGEISRQVGGSPSSVYRCLRKIQQREIEKQKKWRKKYVYDSDD